METYPESETEFLDLAESDDTPMMVTINMSNESAGDNSYTISDCIKKMILQIQLEGVGKMIGRLIGHTL